MKMVISFMAGVVVCSLLYIGVSIVLPARASIDGTTGSTDNSSDGLTRLLPDIEKIYRESLQMPFIKAESKIYDEDIAAYYRDLMDKTGLTETDYR